jgi:Fe2+ or Zn2+ uptake regulation protein
MKYSRQRELILKAVQNHPIHPTADQVYTMLKPEHPKLSLGTVYRNLNLLSETGQIRKIRMPNMSDRFDGNTVSHSHMVCKECGEVYDLQMDWLAGKSEFILEQTGFQMEFYELIVHGICKNCRNKS